MIMPAKRSIPGPVKAAIAACDQMELFLKICFEGSVVIRIIAALIRNVRVILKEIFKQSVSRRMLKQWLELVKEHTQKVSVSIYEGSSVLNALERALANSKLIG